MNIFIICTVRNATEEYVNKLNEYTKSLETEGHTVYLPHRDTNQSASGLNICNQNSLAISVSDEVHIFYNPDSQGTHFDMGVAFALWKRIKVIESVPYGEGKSFARMLREWEEQ